MYLVMVVAVFGMFLSSVVLDIFEFNTAKDKTKQSIIGTRNNLTGSYGNDLFHSPYVVEENLTKAPKVDKEIVTKVLLRTCAHLYAKAKANNCANPREPQTVWGFVGTVNTTGNLIGAWNGAATSTFSCANIDNYGRDLVQKAIPRAFIQQENYRYDFTGMNSTGRTDPCGYSEIVDIN